MKLLTVSNTKTAKGGKLGYLTGILHMIPSDLSGHNVCAYANRVNAGESHALKSNCSRVCLNLSGRGRMQPGGMITLANLKAGDYVSRVQSARLRKTKLFFDNRAQFMDMLADDIAALNRKAIKNKIIAAVRLNGTSDIDYSVIPYKNHANIFAAFPYVQFYDYTKDPARIGQTVGNYHLTYSLHEGKNSTADAVKAFTYGMNVAAVFNVRRGKPLPAVYMGHSVIDGDLSDVRFIDPRGVIVGLRAKGYAIDAVSEFIR